MAIDTFERLNKQYIYDQLNRIHSAAYAAVNAVTGVLTGLTDFHNNYSYDADGNLKSLVRYGNNPGTGALVMGSLKYGYGSVAMNNQLTQLQDYAPNNYAGVANDIPYNIHSSPPSYSYDATGKLEFCHLTRKLKIGQDNMQKTISANLYFLEQHLVHTSMVQIIA